ncbi:hypothetical protein BgiBS90_000302 [Biomphalaria glabrata]|nr:hypothetical protein BgiBS90_000302 [Biomphalaria glabrata]
MTNFGYRKLMREKLNCVNEPAHPSSSVRDNGLLFEMFNFGRFDPVDIDEWAKALLDIIG